MTSALALPNLALAIGAYSNSLTTDHLFPKGTPNITDNDPTRLPREGLERTYPFQECTTSTYCASLLGLPSNKGQLTTPMQSLGNDMDENGQRTSKHSTPAVNWVIV